MILRDRLAVVTRPRHASKKRVSQRVLGFARTTAELE